MSKHSRHAKSELVSTKDINNIANEVYSKFARIGLKEHLRMATGETQAEIKRVVSRIQGKAERIQEGSKGSANELVIRVLSSINKVVLKSLD